MVFRVCGRRSREDRFIVGCRRERHNRFSLRGTSCGGLGALPCQYVEDFLGRWPLIRFVQQTSINNVRWPDHRPLGLNTDHRSADIKQGLQGWSYPGKLGMSVEMASPSMSARGSPSCHWAMSMNSVSPEADRW